MKKFILLTIILFVLCFTFLYVKNYNSISIKNDSYGDKMSIDNYYNEEIYTEKEKNSLDEIIKSINENTQGLNDNIAVYYYNFNTKETYSINEDTYFVAASLKKLPQIMQVLDKVQKGDFSLTTQIEYIDYLDYSDGTGILQFEDNIGSRSIEELIKLSIIESDNISYNMLNRICNNTLKEYIQSIVNDYDSIDEEYVKLTAEQNFQILYRLYTNPGNNPYYSNVIQLMKETAFHHSLDKNIPYEKVAHKISSYYRYYHDTGIIFSEETGLMSIFWTQKVKLFYAALLANNSH